MLRLVLIRHAKSAWDEPGLADFDRPLAPRGRRAAKWIGETLRKEGWVPGRVLCSAAARTRETVALAEIAQEAIYDREIYDLMSADFIDVIRRRGGATKVLALVGHNTGMETTAILLAADNADFGGYPTGAIAVLDFDIRDWSELREGSGRLAAFCRPPKG